MGADGVSDPAQGARTPWPLYLAGSLIVVFMVSTMTYSYRKGQHMTAVYAPLVDASMEIRVEATTAHLWLEEIISGDRKEDIEQVWGHLDEADWYAQAMLEGGTNAENTFIPLDEPMLRSQIERVAASLVQFRALAHERFDLRELGEGAIGSELDQRFDSLFERFVEETDQVETRLLELIAQDQGVFSVTQISLIGLSLVLSAVVAVILRRFESGLRRANAANARQVWIKTGQAELGDAVCGEQDVEELLTHIVGYLAEYVDARVGALYLAAEDGGFELLAGYAFEKEGASRRGFQPGEGLAGQAVLDKKSILVQDVPEDYVTISSALGETRPRHIFVLPMIYEDQVKGIVELGSLEAFSGKAIEFLEETAENMAIAIHGAQARTQLRDLLERTQEQAEELQMQTEELSLQQEELLQTNEELRERTEALETEQNAVRAKNTELDAARRLVEEKNELLEAQLKEIAALRGILPLCAQCKKIRNDDGLWEEMETYIGRHSEAQFSHSVCPDCAKELYPDLMEELDAQSGGGEK